MVYVALNDENVVIGYYTTTIHGESKCNKVIQNGGVVIAPQVWNVITKWYKAKFIGISKEQYITSISDFEEVKKIIEEIEIPKTPIEILDEKVQTLTIENSKLQEQNQIQDELIDITMMATDEIYTMVEPLVGSTFFINNLKEREGKSSMVDMYVAMIQRGLKTVDEVPVRYREQVKAILAELEK